MRRLVVSSFVLAISLASAGTSACEPKQIVDLPGQQAANVYWQIELADAVVVAELVTAEKYALDGRYGGLEMVLRVSKSYKGPYKPGDTVKVDVYSSCVEPRPPPRQVLLYLCGKTGKTLKYCPRSEDWRIEVPGDRALLEKVASGGPK